MKKYFSENEWQIIENGFDPAFHESAESIFSIGNGKMGQRGMFEEQYSGKSLQGSYVAGVYYPDKTRVGWWKNGYPEYFAKVLNSPNWIGMNILIDDEVLDLAKLKVANFKRVLDMQNGLLQRSFEVAFSNNKLVEVKVERFVSCTHDEIACIRYQIKPINFSGKLTWSNFVDGLVKNMDSNYDEIFWDRVAEIAEAKHLAIQVKTKKLDFSVAAGFEINCFEDQELQQEIQTASKPWHANAVWQINMQEGKTYTVEKFVSVVSSLNYNAANLFSACKSNTNQAIQLGYDALRELQINYWHKVWSNCDIKIDGDIAAQQGIRFNIFQLSQTYTGVDERLNIGPKGFTGEKYGGSTYWDTEAYCIPFYLGTSDPKISKQLLNYRYKQLPKAIENAAKLGFVNGAALYPMVTMNGEECHNEWEITFEEIHRNGAIAYAIYNYENYTNDQSYRAEGGAEVLTAIARFWAQRITWSENKKQYVMLGVTGPNEYENNINNNWYTNYIACWCLKYTSQVLAEWKQSNATAYNAFVAKVAFDEANELSKWKHIYENMYFPYDENANVFLQQEGYMDKEQLLASDLNPSERPINQHWSWDRILRSCFIKQADVLQGLFLFEEHFDLATLKNNFDFYEPRTVHESSLSPCIHVIQAAKLGYQEKAYELYLRTARLDLDDYNHEVHEGLHITSMAGTWMAVVMGFGGMRVVDGLLSFAPMLPKQWKGFSFTICFRGAVIKVQVQDQKVDLTLLSGNPISVQLFNEKIQLN
jgi:maltose phosphorylase